MDEAMDSDAARTTLQEGVPRPGFGAMLGAKAFVVVVSSRQFGRLRVIGSSAVTVGRGKSCRLRVTDPAVSTVHCRITSRAGRDRILEDCGSTNGTFVNGRRIDAPVELRYGDRIRIGSTIVRFYVEEVPEKPRS
jgi:pSer/pThr/pTyr-binding forkhead associated (FHA) protein